MLNYFTTYLASLASNKHPVCAYSVHLSVGQIYDDASTKCIKLKCVKKSNEHFIELWC